MSNVLHLVKVRFDVRRADITQEWLDARYSFFQEYTLPSLLRQTNRDWALWINCQDGMMSKIHKLVEILEQTQKEHSWLKVYYSFGDDAILTDNKAITSKYSHVYITRIDSDDLYSPNALQVVRSIVITRNDTIFASMFRRGYKYDVRTKKTGIYTNPSSPFHTMMIPMEKYKNKQSYTEMFNLVGDHSKVASSYYTHVLPDYQFTVLVHDKNFISNFDYSHDTDERIPKGFNLEQFNSSPVVFDVDDFCDQYNCLDELKQLKERYPDFKCSLFTIPAKTSKVLLEEAKSLGFIELCPHGITHEPNEEMKKVTGAQLADSFNKLDYKLYERGFRPPGWFLHSGVIEACNAHKFWLAMHMRDISTYSSKCMYGYYGCGDRFQYWHAHSHNVCGNWLKQDLPNLLVKWPTNQSFSYVSDAVLVPST